MSVRMPKMSTPSWRRGFTNSDVAFEGGSVYSQALELQLPFTRSQPFAECGVAKFVMSDGSMTSCYY
jgi:hypothetical protein